MPGQFITIEGIECVGKSTNAKFIEAMLNKKGCKTLDTREPGGSGIGEKIRNILLFEKKDTLSPCLLYTSPSPRDRTRSRMPSSA